MFHTYQDKLVAGLQAMQRQLCSYRGSDPNNHAGATHLTRSNRVR